MHSKRIISLALVLLFSVAMVLSPCISVSADSFPSDFYVNSNVYYSAEELGYAYIALDSDQQDIANYLMGMYNLFYLGARGFQFKAGTYTSQSSFIAKIKSFGYRILYGATEISMYSRFDADFCKYASAVILYASQCNVTFDTWFENLDDTFTIPVDQGIINSFTLMYNDNSLDAIASFGDIENPWNSGTSYQYGFTGLPWASDYYYQQYLSWVNNNSPFIYTNVSSSNYQVMLHANTVFPNCIFILRGNQYQSYRYGFVSGVNEYRLLNSFDTFTFGNYYLSGGQVYWSGNSTQSMKTDARNIGPFSDLSDFIYHAFSYSPFDNGNFNWNYQWSGYYPLISHVFLVDNLTTLSNIEEIYNVDTWGINGDLPNMLVPIDTVNMEAKSIVTIDLPDNTSTAVSIQDIIDDDNVVDDNGDPVDPWQITVIVQPNDTNPISVDVNMFNGGTAYIDYLWGHTMKMAQYAKDLLDCFDFTSAGGESYGPKFAIYGVLVLGIAGGLVAKFLL